MKRMAIIGQGIAGRWVAWQLLAHLSTDENEEIEIILNDSCLAIPCTTNSSAVAALRGEKQGLSAQFDQLVEAFSYLEDFVRAYAPNGVAPGIQKNLYNEIDVPAALRKYEQVFPATEKQFKSKKLFEAHERCLIFTPEVFLAWLMEESKVVAKKKKITLRFLESHLLEWQKEGKQHRLNFHHGQSELVDTVIFSTGAYHSLIDSALKVEAVNGSYATWNEIELPAAKEWFKDCQVIAWQGHNLTHRSQYHEVLLSGTTVRGEGLSLIPDIGALQSMQKNFEELLGSLFSKEFRINTGLRAKLPKKQKMYGELAPSAYYLNGLYKNGFLLAPYLAKHLVKEIMSEQF